MKTNIAILVPFAIVVFAGCAAPTHVSTNSQCRSLTLPRDCENADGANPNAPKVIVTLNGPMDAVPPFVCAHRGATLEIKLKPNPGLKSTVSTTPKMASHTWLARNNDPEMGVITIAIPEWVTNGDYSYFVYKSDGGCLDPMVHVD